MQYAITGSVLVYRITAVTHMKVADQSAPEVKNVLEIKLASEINVAILVPEHVDKMLNVTS